MSKFGVNHGKTNIANGICDRCRLRMANADMVQDKDRQGIWGHAECMDVIDPWKLPPRHSEDTTVPHPRDDGFVGSAGETYVAHEGRYRGIKP